MGGYGTKLNIESEKTIYKLSNNVYIYDNLSYDHNFVKKLAILLNNGSKFIYSFLNEDKYFPELIKYVDNSLTELNNYLFFEKIKDNKESTNNNNEINTNTNHNCKKDENENKSEKHLNLKFNLKTNNSKTANHKNIPIVKETKNMRRNILKQLDMNETTKFHSNKNNISKEEMEIINRFQKEKPFKVIACDKNVGFMLISNENHRKLAYDHLNNNETYRECNQNDFERVILEINNKIDYLISNKHINKQLGTKLKPKISECKPGRFKILSKVHKDKFGIRPIISCSKHPTAKICALLDQLIKPIVNSINTILKDSQHLLQIAQNKTFKQKPFIYASDFESLYLKIEPDHATNTIPDYLEKEHLFFLKQSYIDKLGLVTLLKIIFEYNIFIFELCWYLQLIGIPMGCICGPTIANIYLFILEKQYINIHNDQMYLRFIDDIFIATEIELDEMELKRYFGYLKLNIVTGETVNFLDLTINFDTIQMKLHFSLYIKPTNSFSYLKTSSNHPSHIFKNIPTSLFLRIRRICSSFTDYLYFSRMLYFQLIKRGYESKILSGIINSIAKTDRLSLIPYKKKNTPNDQSTLKIFFNFETHFEFTKDFFRRELYFMKYNFLFLNNCNFLFINRMRLNLSALFVHNLKVYKPRKNFFKKCNSDNNCICKFSMNNFHFFIDFEKNIKLPILSQSDCSSISCVYIIKCTLCNHFYIGETSREIKSRIKEHLYNINKMNKDIRKSLKYINYQSEVAKHFNLKGHNISDHFSFTVFISNIDDNTKRKSIETDLINILILKNINIINKKIPNFEYINHFTFHSKS
jgi:hypothetical protein